MSWSFALSVATLFAAPFALGITAASAKPTQLLAPVVHENLAIYFIHGPSAAGAVPLTLQEAMTKGAVLVHETGQVNDLVIENTGKEDVFVQAGDIVKGGKQDRVLTVSMLVPANSGKIEIGAYCVEQGRWSARGREEVSRFSSAEKSVPSRAAKLAMLAPEITVQSTASTAQDSEPAMRTVQRMDNRVSGVARSGHSRQSEVWAEVSKIQRALSDNVQESVNSRLSASSLQLSLENKRLAEARSAYVDALKDSGKTDSDIVGIVVAINGRISSADIYPSNGLFQKMWPKLLDAAATEAIGSGSDRTTPPAVASVQAFLTDAENAKTAPAGDTQASPIKREIRDAESSLLVETRKKDGGFVHRAYLSK